MGKQKCKFRHLKMRTMELRCDQMQNDFNGGRDSIAAAAETDGFHTCDLHCGKV